MDREYIRIVTANKDVIMEMWKEELNSLKQSSFTKRISDDVYKNTTEEFVQVIFSCVEERGTTYHLDEFTETLIKLGWPLSYITDGLQSFRRVTIDFILAQSNQVDPTYFSNVLKSVDGWVDPIIRHLVSEYTGSWENIVTLQKVALQELSAPLIPVIEGISIMPLIGPIDTDRAKLIMENLLEGVIKHNSDVVLIDITGVPIVDTLVAHHIIHAAEAVRLIGSTCILVGIRPEIAQTIVNLGIDLTQFMTKSTLRKGFKAALAKTNRKITDYNKESEQLDRMMESLYKE